MLTQAQKKATELIIKATTGYVVLNPIDGPTEILIMDTSDKNTAKRIWRWNMNGFAYSPNGINGPYKTAITMDGEIVADFITAGKMSIARIEGLDNIINDYEKRIAEINIMLDGIRQAVENTIDYKRKQCGTNQIKLENCQPTDLLKFNMCGVKEYNNYLFPQEDLFPSDIFPNQEVI